MIPKLSEPALVGLTCAAIAIVYGALWLAGYAIGEWRDWRWRRKRRRFVAWDFAKNPPTCVSAEFEGGQLVRWEPVLDSRRRHLADLKIPAPWDGAEPPPLDLGRFGCAVRYVMPGESFQLPEIRITLPEAGSGQLAAPADPEASLPDGLIECDGVILFECRVCGEWKPWLADPADFELDDHKLCGGSPRCCP